MTPPRCGAAKIAPETATPMSATPEDGCGTADVEARLLATDADALDQRLDAMAGAVCEKDPRTKDQRRADALGALAHGADRLACACDDPDCDAAGTQPSTVIVHVVANEDSLSDDTPVQLDGEHTARTDLDAIAGNVAHRCTDRSAATTGRTRPHTTGRTPRWRDAARTAAGRQIAGTAKLVPIRHPGDDPPQPRYIPTAVLAWFMRCRDMTCRFPGCDEPAHHCDIDHTIAYPAGPTQASNLKCLCRKHHLLKTFGGWRDTQLPDGTVIWTSPHGQIYTTHPGSRLLFPALCKPTAAVTAHNRPAAGPAKRGLMMPRRKQTREQHRSQAINDERRRNQPRAAARTAERNKPPPF